MAGGRIENALEVSESLAEFSGQMQRYNAGGWWVVSAQAVWTSPEGVGYYMAVYARVVPASAPEEA